MECYFHLKMFISCFLYFVKLPFFTLLSLFFFPFDSNSFLAEIFTVGKQEGKYIAVCILDYFGNSFLAKHKVDEINCKFRKKLYKGKKILGIMATEDSFPLLLYAS